MILMSLSHKIQNYWTAANLYIYIYLYICFVMSFFFIASDAKLWMLKVSCSKNEVSNMTACLLGFKCQSPLMCLHATLGPFGRCLPGCHSHNLNSPKPRNFITQGTYSLLVYIMIDTYLSSCLRIYKMRSS